MQKCFQLGFWVGVAGALLLGSCLLESGGQPELDQTECGNGVREDPETCDGDCPTTCQTDQMCTKAVLEGKADECNVVCKTLTISSCEPGDDCCPQGCSQADDSDCSPTCGNGELEENETCDPINTCPTDASECDDAKVCTTDSLVGSAQNCNVECINTPITDCVGGDGCCPDGCDFMDDNDCTPTYPEGPFGTTENTTIENFEVEVCQCNGTTLQDSASRKAEFYLGNKATMLIVGTGWCSDCTNLANILQSRYYEPYQARGLQILYVLYHTDQYGVTDRQSLLNYSCGYRDRFDMTFDIAIDPKHVAFDGYHSAVPVVMILGPDMQIHKKMQEPRTQMQLQALEDTIDGLLQ